MRILHLADTHFRYGSSRRARVKEYKHVIEKVFEVLSNLEDKVDISVICGDVFDSKLHASGSTLSLIHYFLKGLSKFCDEIHVIGGNHDWDQTYPEEPDMLEFAVASYSKVTYHKYTKKFSVGDVEFAAISVRDFSINGHTRSEEIIDHERLTQLVPEMSGLKTSVALLHATLSGSRISTGKSIQSKIPLSLFEKKGYDLVLAGDVHLQQVGGSVRQEKDGSVSWGVDGGFGKVAYGYPGSMVQQSHAESLDGHGFLIWDTNNKTVERTKIRSSYGKITTRIKSGIIEFRELGREINLEQEIELGRFPMKSVDVRVRGTESDRILVEDTLKKLGVETVHSKIMAEKPEDSSVVTLGKEENKDTMEEERREDIRGSWVDYVCRNIHEEDEKETRMIMGLTKEQLVSFPPSLENCEKFSPSISQRNDKIKKAQQTFEELLKSSMERSKNSMGYSFGVLKFQGLLCFSEANSIDLSFGGIRLLNAKNGAGKTSLLEAIFFSLFGTGFPSRSKHGSAQYLINRESKSAMSSIEIKLENGEAYCIKRKIEISGTSVRSSAIAIDMNKNNLQTRSGKPSVDKFVEEIIGSPDEFLLSSMITQNNDCDFLEFSDKDKMKALERLTGSDVTIAFADLLKVSALAHKQVKTEISAVLNSVENDIARSESRGGAKYTNNQLMNAIVFSRNLLNSKALKNKEEYDKRLIGINEILTSATLRNDIYVSETKGVRSGVIEELNENCKSCLSRRSVVIGSSKEHESVENLIKERDELMALRAKAIDEYDQAEMWQYSKEVGEIGKEEVLCMVGGTDITRKTVKDLELLLAETRAAEMLNSLNMSEMKTKRKVLGECVDHLNNREGLLNRIYSCFIGYRSWYLKECVLPHLLQSTNTLIEHLNNESKKIAKLECSTANGGLIFKIGGVPIERSSGFQRFAAGICLRISLSRSMKTSVPICKSLYIDEGFTSCDVDNMAQVPEFLETLINQGRTNAIVLVTHLEYLSDKVDRTNRIDIIEGKVVN